MRRLVSLMMLFLPSASLAGVHVQQNDPFLNIGSMTVSGAVAIQGPAQSTFTYGVTVGSLNVNGQGNGAITLTISPTGGIAAGTYNVPGSSVTPTVGNFAVFTSTNWTLGNGGTGSGGGTPGGTFNSVQYNNAGVFNGSNNYQWNGTSVTLVSSMTITRNGANNTNPGLLDIFDSGFGTNGGKYIFCVGSTNQGNEFSVRDQFPIEMINYGAKIGSLQIGGTTNGNSNQMWNYAQNLSTFLNIWNGGDITLQTDVSGNGGRDVVLKPGIFEMMRLSASTITVKGTLGITATPSADTYDLTVSSTANFYQVAVSTIGHFDVGGSTSPTLQNCGAGQSVIGTDISGIVTPGATAAGCTVVFTTSYKNVPSCIVTPQTQGSNFNYIVNGTSITVNQPAMTTLFNYFCTGIRD